MNKRKPLKSASAELITQLEKATANPVSSLIQVTFYIPDVLFSEIRVESARKYGLRGKSRWAREAIEEFLNPDNWTTSHAGARPWIRIIADTAIGMPAKKTIDKLNVDKELRTAMWRAAMDAAVLAASDEDNPVYLDVTLGMVATAALTWKLTNSKI